MNSASCDNLGAWFSAMRERFACTHEPAKEKDVVPVQPTAVAGRKHANPSLSVVIVYNDKHAALRAAEALVRLGRNFGGEVRQRFMSVPVAQLDDATRFDRLLFEAHLADMIIVSYNGSKDFPVTLKKWIADCLVQKRAGPSALVALLSSNEVLDAPDSPRYQFLKNASWAAELNFFAPGPDAAEEAAGADAKILERADSGYRNGQ